MFRSDGGDGDHGDALRPKNCCAQCWVKDNIAMVGVHNDILENGSSTRKLVAFIEDDGFRFQLRYHVGINQYSVSAEAFAFHKLISSQLDITGTIFDPPPANIQGNITNTSDPQELVIGFFGAYGVNKKSRFITPEMITDKQPQHVFEDDCRNLPGGSTDIPEVWK